MSRPGGLQLSPVQIVASLLATLTGAILASYLGVGGTLVGAAVGSIASTTGTEIYRHYLRRSQQRLKAAGELLRNRQTGEHAQHAQHGQHAGAQPGGPARPGDAATETLAASRAVRGAGGGRYNGRGPDRSPDATETQIIPAAAGAWPRPPGAGEPAGHTAAEHATGELTGGAGPDGHGSGPWWRGISRRQWLLYGGVTLGVFLVAMVVVTIIELSAGKPLNAAVWGKHSTGTSIGNLVGGGGHRQHQQPAVPHGSSTPTTQPSGSIAPSSSPAATPSGSTPTPSTPVSSSAPAATPTPGGGQASGQAITPTP
jgi:hypothetical protein